jgi:hypothetical protein
MRLGSGGKRPHFLVTHMDPSQVMMIEDGVGQTVQRVSRYAVHPLDAYASKDIHDHLRDVLGCHIGTTRLD